MKAKLVTILVLGLSLGVFLAGCATLSKLEIIGAGNVAVEYGSDFDILEGVTAIGDDGKDYTDKITFETSAARTENKLNTTVVAKHFIKYTCEVGEVKVQASRYVEVKAAGRTGDGLISGGEFDSDADAGQWAVYPETGFLTLGVSEGSLVAKIDNVGQMYEPRISQMNVPFEQGKTYEISFRAKADAEKIINLQVGEILANDPWWTDFKDRQVEHRTIKTDWEEYSYKFTMPFDNKKGGVVFEMGTVDGNAAKTTVYFDWIRAEESTVDPDVKGPDISGIVTPLEVLVGSSFDPMAGISAYDVGDAKACDVTYTIVDSTNATVSAVDTSKAGTYKITYTSQDSLNNKTTTVVNLTVKQMNFSDVNLLDNGDFKTDEPLNDQPSGWYVWAQDWGAAPVVASAINTTAGELTIDLNGGGDAGWAVQLTQEDFTVESGKTYKLSFEVSVSVARDINVAIGYADPDNPDAYTEYFRHNGQMLSTEKVVYSLLFTVSLETHEVKITFELGNTSAFANGVVTFYNVGIYEALED